MTVGLVGSLDLDFNLDTSVPAAVPQTPAPCSTRPTRSRRRVKREETSSDEEDSHTSIQSLVPNIPATTSARSQRASKTVALSKMTAKMDRIRIEEDDEEESSESEVTSDEDSDQFTE